MSAAHALDAEVRLYDRLFTEAEPEKDGRDFKSVLNPRSLEVITAKLEPSLKDAKPELRYQFERMAYFTLDKDSNSAKTNFQPNDHIERPLGEGSAEKLIPIVRQLICCPNWLMVTVEHQIYPLARKHYFFETLVLF